MSKERARRRAEREAEAARRAAERERRVALEARRRARRDRWLAWLPTLPRRTGPSGLLAAKRRRALGLVGLTFVVVQFLTFMATPDWGVRAGVLLVSLLAVPLVVVLAT